MYETHYKIKCRVQSRCWIISHDVVVLARPTWFEVQNIKAFLTHWGRVTHICVGKLTIIDSDNGLSPGRHQSIIWTNVGILLIGPLATHFKEILIGIQRFSFKKMHLKMAYVKWRPFCLGLSVLMVISFTLQCSECHAVFVMSIVTNIDTRETYCPSLSTQNPYTGKAPLYVGSSPMLQQSVLSTHF